MKCSFYLDRPYNPIFEQCCSLPIAVQPAYGVEYTPCKVGEG